MSDSQRFDTVYAMRYDTPELYLTYKLDMIRRSYLHDTRYFNPKILYTEVSWDVERLCRKIKYRENFFKIKANPKKFYAEINEAWSEYYDFKNKGFYPKGFTKIKPDKLDVHRWILSRVIINLLVEVVTIGYTNRDVDRFYEDERIFLKNSFRYTGTRNLKGCVMLLKEYHNINFGGYDLSMIAQIIHLFRDYLKRS